MESMFWGAAKFNSKLPWSTAKVKTLSQCFSGASSFDNNDLSTWDLSALTNVKNMEDIFKDTNLSPCNKRNIADKWKGNAAFDATSYDKDWAVDKCPVRSSLLLPAATPPTNKAVHGQT